MRADAETAAEAAAEATAAETTGEAGLHQPVPQLALEDVPGETAVAPPDSLAEVHAAAFSGNPGRWGIFGHSAGAGSSLLQPGEYALGRAAFAGGAGRMAQYASDDPLFLCSSNGDGLNSFMGTDVALRRAVGGGGKAAVLFFSGQHSACVASLDRRPSARSGRWALLPDQRAAPMP